MILCNILLEFSVSWFFENRIWKNIIKFVYKIENMIRLKNFDTRVFTLEYCTRIPWIKKKIIKEKKPFIHFNYIYDHRTSFFFFFFFKLFRFFREDLFDFQWYKASIVSAIVTYRGVRERVVNWLEQNRVNFLSFYRDCKANSSRARVPSLALIGRGIDLLRMSYYDRLCMISVQSPVM